MTLLARSLASGDPLLDAEQRALALVVQHGHDHLVEEVRGYLPAIRASVADLSDREGLLYAILRTFAAHGVKTVYLETGRSNSTGALAKPDDEIDADNYEQIAGQSGEGLDTSPRLVHRACRDHRRRAQREPDHESALLERVGPQLELRAVHEDMKMVSGTGVLLRKAPTPAAAPTAPAAPAAPPDRRAAVAAIGACFVYAWWSSRDEAELRRRLATLLVTIVEPWSDTRSISSTSWASPS